MRSWQEHQPNPIPAPPIKILARNHNGFDNFGIVVGLMFYSVSELFVLGPGRGDAPRSLDRRRPSEVFFESKRGSGSGATRQQNNITALLPLPLGPIVAASYPNSNLLTVIVEATGTILE